MSAFIKAASYGFASKDILEQLGRQFPHFKDKIEKAAQMGYTTEEIYDYLSKLDKKKSKEVLSKPITKEEDREYEARIQRRGRNLTQAEQASAIEYRKEEETKSKLKKGALAAGGLLAGGAAAYGARALLGRAGQAIIPEVLSEQTAIGFSPKAITGRAPPQIGYSGPAPKPTNPIPPPPAQSPISPASAPTASQILKNTPDLIKDPKLQHVDIINNLGVGDFIRNLSTRNNAEQIAGALSFQLKPEQKKWLKDQTNVPLSQIVNDYLSTSQKPLPTNNQEENLSSPMAPESTSMPKLNPMIQTYQRNSDGTYPELQPTKEPATQKPKKMSRSNQDADITFPKEFFKGKSEKDVAELNNRGIEESVNELLERTAEGEEFETSYGDEWKAVGFKDVTEKGKESYPKAKGTKKTHINDIIDRYVPIRGLYAHYFNTAEKRKRMPFSKFQRDVEKSVTELALKKQNPEKYASLEKEQNDRLDYLLKPQKAYESNSLDDEMIEEIDDILFGKKSKDYEDLIEKLMKSIR